MSNTPPKQFFAVFSVNTAFFEKIVEYKNICRQISDKKGYIHFWCKMSPDRSHSDPAAALQSKGSEISLFWLTSCARDFFLLKFCGDMTIFNKTAEAHPRDLCNPFIFGQSRTRILKFYTCELRGAVNHKILWFLIERLARISYSNLKISYSRISASVNH